MRASVVLIVLALLTGSAYAMDLPSCVAPDGYPIALPEDFDYATGYSEYQIGEELWEAYIAQPMVPGAEPLGTQIVYAEREGWIWAGGGYNGGCTCISQAPPDETPELRTNDINSYDQRIFFEYKVPRAASTKKILVAVLRMYCCDTGSYEPIAVECWDATIEVAGAGDSYDLGCGSRVPRCVPTLPYPHYNLSTFGKTTTVDVAGKSYDWAIRNIVQEWCDRAPTTGCLMLFGTGEGKYKRFSSSCNYDYPDIRPFLYVKFQKK